MRLSDYSCMQYYLILLTIMISIASPFLRPMSFYLDSLCCVSLLCSKWLPFSYHRFLPIRNIHEHERIAPWLHVPSDCSCSNRTVCNAHLTHRWWETSTTSVVNKTIIIVHTIMPNLHSYHFQSTCLYAVLVSHYCLRLNERIQRLVSLGHVFERITF